LTISLFFLFFTLLKEDTTFTIKLIWETSKRRKRRLDSVYKRGLQNGLEANENTSTVQVDEDTSTVQEDEDTTATN
jgi:hypothetical protein